MPDATDVKLMPVWSAIKNDAGRLQESEITYRRVTKGVDVWASIDHEGYYDLLIKTESDDYDFPSWRGMKFDLINDPIRNTGNSIRLRDENLQEVPDEIFVHICEELVRQLKETEPPGHQEAIGFFLEKWSSFFKQHGSNGLSDEKQRGLFGELFWLRKLLENNIDPSVVLKSWKGQERAYHDFDIKGYAVEVNTTISKAVKKIKISNERQLDDKGFESLRLFVLALMVSEGGGESLPEIISSVREKILSSPRASNRFEGQLYSAGYLPAHENRYTSTYTPTNGEEGELFIVREGFPRITETQLPDGVGDISYSVSMAHLDDFKTETDVCVSEIRGIIR